MLSIGKLANGQANYYLDLAGERVDRGSSVAKVAFGGDVVELRQGSRDRAHARSPFTRGGRW